MQKTKDIIDNIVAARTGGLVERCHLFPHTGSYSVATHSWGAAMLMWNIWPEDFPKLGATILAHDIPECLVGDIPSPTKRNIEGLSERLKEAEIAFSRVHNFPSEHDLEGEDYDKVKICDSLDLYLWCREQTSMGNKFAVGCLWTINNYLHSLDLPDPISRVLAGLERTPDLVGSTGEQLWSKMNDR